jgi:hypothetical protein
MSRLRFDHPGNFANVFDLIGIQLDALQGTRALWGERLYHEDRVRLLARLEQLQSSEIVSENHRLLDDQGYRYGCPIAFKRSEKITTLAYVVASRLYRGSSGKVSRLCRYFAIHS